MESGANKLPASVEEFADRWLQELSRRPPTTKPTTRHKVEGFDFGSISDARIIKVDIADLGFLIQGEHGVYDFRELGAARIVDAASIDPNILESIRHSDSASVFDLTISSPFVCKSTYTIALEICRKSLQNIDDIYLMIQYEI